MIGALLRLHPSPTQTATLCAPGQRLPPAVCVPDLPHLDRARPLFGVSERFEPAASQEMPRAAPHRRPTPTALFSLLHLAMQEETMQDDRDRYSRAAAITAVLTLSCTIGVLYLPLFLL